MKPSTVEFGALVRPHPARLIGSVKLVADEAGGIFAAEGGDGIMLAAESVELSGERVRHNSSLDKTIGNGNIMNAHDIGERAIIECLSPMSEGDGLYRLKEGASVTFASKDGNCEKTVNGPAILRELRPQPLSN